MFSRMEVLVVNDILLPRSIRSAGGALRTGDPTLPRALRALRRVTPCRSHGVGTKLKPWLNPTTDRAQTSARLACDMTALRQTEEQRRAI